MTEEWVAVVRAGGAGLLAVGVYDHDFRAEIVVRALLEAYPEVRQAVVGELGVARLVNPEQAAAILTTRQLRRR